MEDRPIEEIAAEDRREMYRLNDISHVAHNVHAQPMSGPSHLFMALGGTPPSASHVPGASWDVPSIKTSKMSRKRKQAATNAANPPRVRTSRNSSRGREDDFPNNRFDHQIHYDRWKGMENRGIVHERIVRIDGEEEPIFRNCIQGLGWGFMYDDLVRINLSIVREFCANFSSANQDHVFLRGKRIPFTETHIRRYLVTWILQS
ncbi:hypothetical protein PIB30_054999 [Stylosanthes scabra]|uniref:Uncharacterized protein n=1 Tax=Stylosanthes scabra TaxID=79078 RepID=A0ABU6XKI4_9FABA|nr:hypothetical protein [Stylosanthes scabra]